jgi:hypothetical protein
MLARRLGFLLEAMQHVDGFLELGNVQHAKDAAAVLDPDFLGTRSDINERLSIVRVQTGLYFPQLKARSSASVIRQALQVVIGGTDPANLFCIFQ